MRVLLAAADEAACAEAGAPQAAVGPTVGAALGAAVAKGIANWPAGPLRIATARWNGTRCWKAVALGGGGAVDMGCVLDPCPGNAPAGGCSSGLCTKTCSCTPC